MTSHRLLPKIVFFFLGLSLVIAGRLAPAYADPSKYPEFAQQAPPPSVKPEFIGVEALVRQLRAGAKPLIVDVRTPEEYREAHILSSVSAPLAEFKDHMKSMPRDRLVVLY